MTTPMPSFPNSSRIGLRRLLVLAAGLFLLAQAVPGPVSASTREDLDRARTKLKGIERQLKGIQARKQALQGDILSLTTQINQALRQKEAIEDQIHAIKGGIKDSNGRVEELRVRLNDRARDVYIQGPASMLSVMLDARSITDLSDRASFIDVLSRGDANLATGIEVEKQQLQKFADQFKGLRKEQVALLKEFKKQRKELDGLWLTARAVEALIQVKVREANKVVEKLERKYQNELLAAISLQTGGPPPPDIDGKPGPLYVCPVDPPRSYVNDFGAPRVGHTHQGNDIFAPQGTPIRAPFDGRAEEGSNGLGGNTVHVYADNGDYVYNAHMVKYAGVSGRVQAGQIIGYVGDTGNARGTPYHDHFEYHPGGGSAVTPFYYLNEVCGINGAA